MKNQMHRSLTLAARDAAITRYRTATVRESVPFWAGVFNGVTTGLRPTKVDEDADVAHALLRAVFTLV